MITLIIIIDIVMFLVLVGWTWSSLGEMDKSKKIGYLIVSIAITFLITYLIFGISKSKINYSNDEYVAPIRNLLVTMFTSINGYVIVQYIAKVITLVNEEEIERKVANRKIRKILIIFIIVAIFEVFYLRDIQNGILERIVNLSR